MIFDTTYTNKEYNESCKELLGHSFSFFQRIKKGGIGSARLIIAQTSPTLTFREERSHRHEYANIEMRPKGIIVHMTSRLERYAWLIPYYRLHFYSSDLYSIHAEGHYIKFYKDRHYILNKSFLEKVRNEKIKFLNLGYYDG